jgi:hypothetical protein
MSIFLHFFQSIFFQMAVTIECLPNIGIAHCRLAFLFDSSQIVKLMLFTRLGLINTKTQLRFSVVLIRVMNNLSKQKISVHSYTFTRLIETDEFGLRGKNNYYKWWGIEADKVPFEQKNEFNSLLHDLIRCYTSNVPIIKYKMIEYTI